MYELHITIGKIIDEDSVCESELLTKEFLYSTLSKPPMAVTDCRRPFEQELFMIICLEFAKDLTHF